MEVLGREVRMDHAAHVQVALGEGRRTVLRVTSRDDAAERAQEAVEEHPELNGQQAELERTLLRAILEVSRSEAAYYREACALLESRIGQRMRATGSTVSSELSSPAVHKMDCSQSDDVVTASAGLLVRQTRKNRPTLHLDVDAEAQSAPFACIQKVASPRSGDDYDEQKGGDADDEYLFYNYSASQSKSGSSSKLQATLDQAGRAAQDALRLGQPANAGQALLQRKASRGRLGESPKATQSFADYMDQVEAMSSPRRNNDRATFFD